MGSRQTLEYANRKAYCRFCLLHATSCGRKHSYLKTVVLRQGFIISLIFFLGKNTSRTLNSFVAEIYTLFCSTKETNQWHKAQEGIHLPHLELCRMETRTPRFYFCLFDLHLVYVRTFLQFPLRFRLSFRTVCLFCNLVQRVFAIFKMACCCSGTSPYRQDPGDEVLIRVHQTQIQEDKLTDSEQFETDR